MSKKEVEIKTIKVGDADIRVVDVTSEDGAYLCISDFVEKGGTGSSGITIINWLKNKNTIEFLGIWESLNNDNFNVMEFHNIKNEAGTNRFLMSVKQWISKTNAIGLRTKAGRYNSGTYAHIDIALEFASWLSPELKLYIIKEFKRLKKQEALTNNEEWDIARLLSKINYQIHTDAVQQNIIPYCGKTPDKYWIEYANEADLMNCAVFGMNASDFRSKHPKLAENGKNMRDIATTEQLIVLKNIESSNASMIREGLSKEQRFAKMTIQAKEELESLRKRKNKIPKRENLFFQQNAESTMVTFPESVQVADISEQQIDEITTKEMITKKSKK